MSKDDLKGTSTFRTGFGYFLYVCIAVVSAIAAFMVGPDVLKAIVGFPGAVSLAAIPWQLFRDQRAHERQMELADHNSAVALGVDSPMAKAAFENYSKFAEEYAAEMADVISKIVAEGPRGSQLGLAQRLMTIRRRHALWVPKATDTDLFRLEDTIWRMAVDAGFTESVQDRGEMWNARYDKAQERWCSLIGMEFTPIFPENSPATQDDVTINLQQMAMTALKQVLGTEQFSTIRALAISRALGAQAQASSKSN